jgi:hypothetical protein
VSYFIQVAPITLHTTPTLHFSLPNYASTHPSPLLLPRLLLKTLPPQDPLQVVNQPDHHHHPLKDSQI